MPLAIVEVQTDLGHVDTLKAIAEQHHAIDCWETGVTEDDRSTVRILVRMQERQGVLDAVQRTFSGSDNWRAVIVPVEATVPKPVAPTGHNEEASLGPAMAVKRITREELYQDVSERARLDWNYLMMAGFATLVAAIGMIEDSVAIVIGAMVIAPYLGPQLALGFAAVTGNKALLLRGLLVTLAGLAVTLVLSALMGLLLGPFDEPPTEILVRTLVGFDGMAIALASGAAATLALTTGRATTLIGVMVAVALLPPAVVMGLMLGTGAWEMATGAALLLAVNITCINVAAQLVFLSKGIRPRTLSEQAGARTSFALSFMVWVALLFILAWAIYRNTQAQGIFQ
ncbi:MAG: TIGR00341 family protein [Gammaproteobacteria bacterium]|nr:TIGR00341 family protein [Gammaproteobacteria bacterium]